ncbi:transposase [Cyanobium sp. Copco_Reservoir_LC18]|uniref:IS5 family transposase n=1 Tax=Cyanobium sp. Copco_Reservoir_LC18 TaxID=1328305 RepID=UPI0013567BDF|nr:IS5 family transposase [Cyanobium sp. Copco_Reservoir_LC18]KAF0654668.1 transposase [Cyanobium sp. Copco_Reservoir_LC18]
MRGQQERTGPLFSYVSTEERIPKAHPLRQVRRLADQALDRLNPTFCRLYPEGGRPSIPPEQLLLALLLQAIYGIRSERMLIEQLDYNLLFRWFVGLDPDDPVWHPTTFTKNRDRLLNEELMARFLELLLAAPEVKPLLSSEHFSVDGTLLRAWASHSSLERIDGIDDDPFPPSSGKGFGAVPAKGKKRAKGDFRGLLLSNQTHRSSSDSEARLFRKSNSTGAYLSFLGHCLMENRHGLVVASEVTPADGYGERSAAVRMARSLPGSHRKTLAADKGYDTKDFVADIRFAGITPHVAQNIQARRRSAIDGRTTRHGGYGKSINARKRIEQVFGWIKQAAGLRQLKARGRSRVGAVFRLHVVAYNLIRLANLLSPREVMA